MNARPVNISNGQLCIALIENQRVQGVYQLIVHSVNKSARLEKATPSQREEALRVIARCGKSNNQP